MTTPVLSSGCTRGCTHQHGLDEATHALRMAIDADPTMYAEVLALRPSDQSTAQRPFADALHAYFVKRALTAPINYFALAGHYLFVGRPAIRTSRTVKKG